MSGGNAIDTLQDQPGQEDADSSTVESAIGFCS